MKKIIVCIVAIFCAVFVQAQQPENNAAKFPEASAYTNGESKDI